MRDQQQVKTVSGVELTIGAENSPLVECDSPLRLQIVRDARTIRNGVAQPDQVRHLLLEPPHALWEGVTQPLDDLIFKTFAPNCFIDRDDHPALLRLIGAKQSLA